MDQKQTEIIDNCKRVFDYPYIGYYDSLKSNLFLSTEESPKQPDDQALQIQIP